MILCAGLGTRLRPLTDWLAKPMVPIGDAPAVEHVARRLRAAGVDRIVVNVFHRPTDLRAWGESQRVAISEEHELLGTAGGVAHASSLLSEGDLVVHNGDILSELDIGTLLRSHVDSRAAATLAVVPRRGREGNVGLADDGRIVRLRASSFGEEVRSADFVGVQVLGRLLRQELSGLGCLVGDVYIPALARGVRLASHTVSEPFVDIGSLDAYVAANQRWLERRGLEAWAAEDAVIDASIAGSIVGSGARVEADAIDSIVWPGAHVRAPVARSIVTPYGIVRP